MKLNISIIEALKKLLADGHSSTQEEIRLALARQGIVVNQSKISRLLRKLDAVKKVNAQKKTCYSLPIEPPPPLQNSSLTQLVLDVVANETLIVVRTNPGSASLIARLLDHHYLAQEILGTLAGDDTLFVVPKSIHDIKNLTAQIKRLLLG